MHATAVEAAGLRSLPEDQKVSFDLLPNARAANEATVKAVSTVSTFCRTGRWSDPPALVSYGRPDRPSASAFAAAAGCRSLSGIYCVGGSLRGNSSVISFCAPLPAVEKLAWALPLPPIRVAVAV